jgi:hypothetical protein
LLLGFTEPNFSWRSVAPWQSTGSSCSSDLRGTCLCLPLRLGAWSATWFIRFSSSVTPPGDKPNLPTYTHITGWTSSNKMNKNKMQDRKKEYTISMAWKTWELSFHLRVIMSVIHKSLNKWLWIKPYAKWLIYHYLIILILVKLLLLWLYIILSSCPLSKRDAIIVFEIKKEIINLEKSHLKQVCSNTWESRQKPCDVIARWGMEIQESFLLLHVRHLRRKGLW